MTKTTKLKRKIIPIGSSLGIIIPQKNVFYIDVKKGDEVEVIMKKIKRGGK